MFKLTSAVLALVSTASAAGKLQQFVPCDAQMRCDAVLTKA